MSTWNVWNATTTIFYNTEISNTPSSSRTIECTWFPLIISPSRTRTEEVFHWFLNILHIFHGQWPSTLKLKLVISIHNTSDWPSIWLHSLHYSAYIWKVRLEVLMPFLNYYSFHSSTVISFCKYPPFLRLPGLIFSIKHYYTIP